MERIGRKFAFERIAFERIVLWVSVGGLLLAAAIGVVAFKDLGRASAATPARPVAGAPTKAVARLDITIVTDAMTGKMGSPAFVPSDFTVPANTLVQVRIVNFDGATPIAPRYAAASGIVGNAITIAPFKASSPNTAGAPRTVSALPPAQVSHTFTVPALGINVPIAGNSIETFSFRTGAAGTYAWHCMDPCGSGTVGWGAAMGARHGFMEGTLTVTA
jgi:hypothetical protein